MNGESSCGFSLRANHAAAGFPRQPTEGRLPDGKLSNKNKWEEGGCDPKSAGKFADRGSATRSSFRAPGRHFRITSRRRMCLYGRAECCHNTRTRAYEILAEMADRPRALDARRVRLQLSAANAPRAWRFARPTRRWLRPSAQSM